MRYSEQKINFSPRTVAILIAVSVLISVFLLINQAQACTCPLTSQSGRTIINFDTSSIIRSDKTQTEATKGPVSVSIPAGNYDITLVSYDNHSDKPGQYQPSEAFYLILKNSQGGVIVNTPAISDLPDNLDYLTEKVASNFSISQDISSVTAFHAGYPSSNPNSITPVCAAFDRINVNPPDLIINKAVDKTQASPGEEIVYTLSYQNIGDTQATGVVIKDKFDYLNQQYLTFISSTPSPSSGTDTWNIGNVNPGQSGQITIRARISNSVPSGTIEIKNRGSIDSNETPFMYSNCVSTFVTGSANVELTIEKLVRNISDGTGWYSSVDAEPRDEIEFSIEIRNTTNSTANNVKVWDDLPGRLDYIYGSTRVDGSYHSDEIISGGIYIGDLNPYQSKTVKFKVEVASEDEFYSQTTTLTNYGYARADNYHSISDTATVRVEKEQEEDLPALSIDKLVRNLTRGSSGWTNTVYAKPGDEIEFLIRVDSVGDKRAEDVRVWDELPSKLTYISGSTRIDDSYRADGIIYSSGIWLGDLNTGDEKEVKFKARVASAGSFGSSSTTLTNQAYTWADDVSRISDYAKVIVEKEDIPSTRAISINKLGRNLSQGQTSWFDSFLAKPGEELEFSIQVTNIGNASLTNVRVWDTLPSQMSYISGSTTVNGVYHSDGIVSGGIYIGTLSANQSKTIKFRAKVASQILGGSGTITINVGSQTTQSPSGVSISKSGRNVSRGQTTWSASFEAAFGEELEFSIQVINVSGSNLSNVKIKEILPANLSIISGSTTVDGASWGGDVTGGGLDLGTLNQGQSKTIKFRVRVSGGEGFSGSVTLINTAYGDADNVSQVSDQASVTVSQPGQVLGMATVATGSNLIALIFLAIISAFIAFIVYCRVREDKLLEVFNGDNSNKLSKTFIKLYFKIKFFFTATKLRFKKVYW